MSPMRSALLIVLAVVVWAGQAIALDVYLNGVLITGVRDQEFEDATVTIDSNGNVRIKAPHYQVERTDTKNFGPGGTKQITSKSPPSKSRPPTISSSSSSKSSGQGRSLLDRRYWLVAQVSEAGMVQYRIEVRVNGQLVRSFTDADVPAPIEVTSFLRQGQNRVRITADKITEGGRRSESSRHWLRVVVADGHIEGASVVIDRPGVIFTRNAAQIDRASREFTLNAE